MKVKIHDVETQLHNEIGMKEAAELLVTAVAEDSVPKLQVVIVKIGKSVLPTLRFDYDMNILNLAIDQQSFAVVQFL